MEISGLTKEEMDDCHLLSDPLTLEDVLGQGNAEGPSVQDLIEGGKSKRRRVVWTMDTKLGNTKSMMPGSLISPVEKYLANYLYTKVAPSTDRSMKPVMTLVFNKRHGREATPDMVRKKTILGNDGLRTLRENLGPRLVKDCTRFCTRLFVSN